MNLEMRWGWITPRGGDLGGLWGRSPKFRGVHPLEAMMHFLLCFRFPLFPKKFLTPWKISQILPFPEKFFNFHPPKFLMTFFRSSTTNFKFPPFSLFQYIYPYFDKIILPPTFINFSPVFANLRFFTYFMCFSFP